MSVDSKTLERIKAQLREAQSTGGNVQQDLYGHLTEVFNRVIMHHPTDAYDKFEEISALVKGTNLKFKDPAKDSEVNAAHSVQTPSEQAKHVQKCKDLMDGVMSGPKSMISAKKQFILPNFAEEAEMLEWANIGFGEEDTYKLQHSIKRLCVMSGADRIRFVGKIYGTKQDYWILSGCLDDEGEGLPKSVEKRGAGVNQYVYWVTDNLLNDWIQLPECRPEYITCSMQIKHIFTGDLNAEIKSSPNFPGKERHLLRAQLARIFHSTAMIPKGLMEMEEDNPEPKYGEEFTMPSIEDLKNLENWSNLFPAVLKGGRCTHPDAPEGMEEEAAAAWKEELEGSDPIVDRFRGINEQKGMPGTGATPEEDKSFVVKLVGDTQQYNQLPPKEGTTSYATLVIRSLRWPGAVTVCKGGKMTSIYIGYGLKRGGASFQPTEPPKVESDPMDAISQIEPTPLDSPRAAAEVPAEGEGEAEAEDE